MLLSVLQGLIPCFSFDSIIPRPLLLCLFVLFSESSLLETQSFIFYSSISIRSIHLAYVNDVEVKGIQAYRFAPPNDVLMSPKENPTNEGFCVPAGDCLGTGVLKVSVCREGERGRVNP